jgi:hypothetical protein
MEDDVEISITVPAAVYEKLSRLSEDDPWERDPGEIVVEDFLIPYLAEIEIEESGVQGDPVVGEETKG